MPIALCTAFPEVALQIGLVGLAGRVTMLAFWLIQSPAGQVGTPPGARARVSGQIVRTHTTANARILDFINASLPRPLDPP